MTNIAYSTATGDAPPTSDDTIIEPVVARNLRVTDSRYGLKTAAKADYEAKQSAVFHAARTAALSRQRTEVQTRLRGLQRDIRTIMAGLESGKITGLERIDGAFEKLERMGRAESKMVDDIARLTIKIGGSA